MATEEVMAAPPEVLTETAVAPPTTRAVDTVEKNMIFSIQKIKMLLPSVAKFYLF